MQIPYLIVQDSSSAYYYKGKSVSVIFEIYAFCIYFNVLSSFFFVFHTCEIRLDTIRNDLIGLFLNSV